MGSHARQVVALWAQSAVLLFHLVQQTVGERSTPQLFTFSTTDREPPDWDQLLPLGQLHAPFEVNGRRLTPSENHAEVAVYGLQQLYADWDQSTPELGKNLAGWKAIPQDFGAGSICPCYRESWQGVLCLRQLMPTEPGFNYQLYKVWLVGLALTDASLTGSLPPAIGNLSSLVYLTITGNKGLKGRLPLELQRLRFNLNILDLQGNGFDGSVPTTLASLNQLQQLDLSGNQFNGTLQVNFKNLTWLRTLNLSRNSLTGNINQTYFQNLGQLITLDLSSNNFTGPLFNLTGSPSLNTLNVSYNSFSGDVRLSKLFNNTFSLNLKVVDLSKNAFTGLIPDFSSWTNLTVLDLSYNQFQAAPFPLWIKNLPKALQVLRLEGNNLAGQIPDHFLQDFMDLKTLALDNNQINGSFDIGDVIGLPMLASVSITNNSITDVLYSGPLAFKNLTKFGINLQGNPYCVRISPQDYLKQCVCMQNCLDPEITQDANKASTAVVATSTAASAMVIIILIISLVFWKTRREKQKLQLQVKQHFAENDIKPTIFTFNQLRVATEDFSERTKIGEGSFGAVYKGNLQANGNPVAVKQLFIKNQQSITEFLNEVVVVTAIKHRNLVNLKGCCVREDQRLLVYEYLNNKDLAHHLFHQRENQHLTWPARFNICLGVARGLHYLHVSAQPRIIHRDIKASNILMDQELQPKIADFGLALFFPDEQSHIITSDIAGTRGYWAPEYATLGQLSEKADIYSFGILLLEVVSGRKNLDSSMPEHKVYLGHWGRELYNNSNVMELVDQAMSLSKEEELAVRRIINIALLCIQGEPERRPTMGAVVATLDGSLNLEAEGMKHLSPAKAPRRWMHLEEYPLQSAVDLTPRFSSSTISMASVGNYSSFGSVSTLENLPVAPQM